MRFMVGDMIRSDNDTVHGTIISITMNVSKAQYHILYTHSDFEQTYPSDFIDITYHLDKKRMRDIKLKELLR